MKKSRMHSTVESNHAHDFFGKYKYEEIEYID